MLRFGHVALLAAIGCSPVKDYSNVPDAPVDSTDMRPPEIASSVPMHMATKVSILTPISVFFDERLDPASVDATTVKLSYVNPAFQLVFPGTFVVSNHGPGQAGATAIKGTVSYDEAARKVSFVPAAPLPYGVVLTLTLDVKDRGGVAFTGSVTFMTYVNGNTRQFNYNNTGRPTSWVGQPTDMNGRQAKRTGGSAPGTDQIWFTPDDPRNYHYSYVFSPDGRIVEERQHTPGTDGQYDTADDPINVCVRYFYNAQNVLTERTYSTTIGPDNMWCTNDDVPVVNAIYTYADGKLSGFVYNTHPGTDTNWRTPDDRCAIYWEYSYDPAGNRTREVYRGCGTDNLPRTADDYYDHYYEYEYDAAGNLTRTTYRPGPGPDGVWLTPDDDINRVERYLRDPDGQLVDKITTTGPGADMMWGTADDTPGTRIANKYNAKKLVEEITTYSGFGADMMWGTDDDVISSYSKLTYDDNGNRTDLKQYNSGVDGVWKNDDDRVVIDLDYDLGR